MKVNGKCGSATPAERRATYLSGPYVKPDDLAHIAAGHMLDLLASREAAFGMQESVSLPGYAEDENRRIEEHNVIVAMTDEVRAARPRASALSPQPSLRAIHERACEGRTRTATT